MQAVNRPEGSEVPFSQHVGRDPIELPEPTEHRHRSGRWAALSGAALVLVLGGFLVGSQTMGPSGSPHLPEAALGGFAEMYVATLLTQAGEGAEDVLVPYLGYPPDLTGLEPGTWFLTHTAVWSVEPVEPDGWAVVVAAAQLGLQEGGYVPVGTFFYEVGVELTSTGLRAAGLPFLVAPPFSRSPQETFDADERFSDVVDEFLTAHFTNEETTPFDTAPFDRVLLRSITTERTVGDLVDLGVELLGIDFAGRATPLAYRLRVSAQDGSIVDAGLVNPVSN